MYNEIRYARVDLFYKIYQLFSVAMFYVQNNLVNILP